MDEEVLYERFPLTVAEFQKLTKYFGTIDRYFQQKARWSTLPPKRVQMLARMSTIALLDRYSRNLRMGDYSWLNQGPKLVEEDTNKKAG